MEAVSDEVVRHDDASAPGDEGEVAMALSLTDLGWTWSGQGRRGADWGESDSRSMGLGVSFRGACPSGRVVGWRD